jgi:NAD(P)-dependent dehydrogenase (short-subunit alcohol dehydrogenase family)
MDSGLEGRIAVVTGGGRGIGAATAKLLAQGGARVVVSARTAAQLATVVDEIRAAGGEAEAVVCDVSDDEQVAALFAATAERFGPVDILINNAGTVAMGPVAEMSRADWDRVIGVNLTGVFLCSQQALKQMLPRKSGVIVNVSSVAGVPGVDKFPGIVAYSAAKGGVILFSEALAAECAGTGVRVLSVSPAATNTQMLRAVAPDVAANAMTPETVGKVIAFAASDAAAGVTNTNIDVWGTA